MPMSPFQQHVQLFYYKSANGLVQIDITPDWQVCLGHDYPLQTAFILIAFSPPTFPRTQYRLQTHQPLPSRICRPDP